MQLKRFWWGWLTTFWTVSAWAAQLTFADDLASIPPAAVAVAVGLSLIGGAAFTATKLADKDVVVKSVLLEIIKDILTSVVVGLLAFFIGSWFVLPTVLQAACITIAGYGGSRVLEPGLAAFITWVSRLGSKAT